jgi:hypothetical protein
MLKRPFLYINIRLRETRMKWDLLVVHPRLLDESTPPPANYATNETLQKVRNMKKILLRLLTEKTS